MVGKLRYWKEKDGRFWARMAVPEALRVVLGKSEIIEPLGGDRRAAIKGHPAAVTRLQARLSEAEAQLGGVPFAAANRDSIATADFGRAVWQAYRDALKADDVARNLYPSPAELAKAQSEAISRLNSIDTADPFAVFDAALDYLVSKEARSHDAFVRSVRLDALRSSLAAGETHLVTHEVDAFLDRNNLTAGPAERAVLATRLMRAEIEAMQRTMERDLGHYAGQPADPVVKPAASPAPPDGATVGLSQLWASYVAGRVRAGFMKDGGKRQAPVIKSLRKFLTHDDAGRITKKNIIEWREHLMIGEKLSAKTVNDIYLSTVRSLFAWAHENEKLPEDIASGVKQPKPRKVQSRERGYTDAEAVMVLRAARNHTPTPNQSGYVRETAHMTAAKRWVPILCAFSGARVSEITQLRKEDIRQEGDRWVIRITPDAGSVKAGGYRDVPLHRQIVAEGFNDFIQGARTGPLFHGADDQKRYATAAASVSDELAKWLRRGSIAPEGIQPNHAWRHRLKTQGRDLGLSDRVIDAIQGHAGRTASDGYGDVSVTAKMRVIDALPDYPI